MPVVCVHACELAPVPVPLPPESHRLGGEGLCHQHSLVENLEAGQMQLDLGSVAGAGGGGGLGDSLWEDSFHLNIAPQSHCRGSPALGLEGCRAEEARPDVGWWP